MTSRNLRGASSTLVAVNIQAAAMYCSGERKEGSERSGWGERVAMYCSGERKEGSERSGWGERVRGCMRRKWGV